jgi:hypothetical protein
MNTQTLTGGLTARQQRKAVTAFEAQTLPALFVPLYTRYFEAFKAGRKKTEFRTYGRGWNERTCLPGRRVTLSKGYGKYERMAGVIAKFSRRGTTACIGIRLVTS